MCAANSFRVGVATPQSFVIADRLAYCRISYQDRDPTTYIGGVAAAVGQAGSAGGGARGMAPLIPDPARLPLVSVTVPIHINRDVNATYTDSQ